MSLVNQIYEPLVQFIAPITGANLTSLLTTEPLLNSKTGKDLWYWKHLNEWKKSPGSLISIGLQAHQLSLISMVDEENTTEYNHPYKGPDEKVVYVPYLKGKVKFLSLFGHFSFQPDADVNRYYVANPYLFSDLIHVNHLGYYTWGDHLNLRLGNLGWKNLPEPTLVNGESCRTWNCGSAEEPPFGGPIVDPQPDPVIVEPSNIDWLVLICFFTGKCW